MKDIALLFLAGALGFLLCWVGVHLFVPAQTERVQPHVHCFAELQGGQITLDGDVWTLLPPNRVVCDACGETWDIMHGCGK